jgi:hypothetical protein
MNLMKWLRKNNKKLMAVVVIVLMVAFIGGSSFQYLFRGSGGVKEAVAYFGRNQKISHQDLRAADQEVEIVSALGADSVARAQGMAGLLLSELVFRQNGNAAALDMARQAIQKNRYRISDQQLSEMSNTHGVPGPMFWILLCNEAQQAGIHVSNEQVGKLLEQIIPQVFEGRTYAQIVPGMMNRFGVPEDTIVGTFGKFIAVLQYAQVVSSVENITTSQIKHLASNESESLTAEMIQLKASYFVNKGETPSEEAVKQQFERYKDNVPGQVSESNPYGFGYRLPDRIQFDYLALKLSDVAAVAKPPTQEEAEQYYQQNRDRQFTQRTPSDPNDPNSPAVAKVKTYAEVSQTIMDQLRHQRITAKAEQILQEARLIADVNLPGTYNGQEPTAEQRMKKAGDYAKIAAELGKKYSLPLYSGRTGQLSVANMQSDKVLRRMFLAISRNNAVPLTQILFSVKELGDHATILLSLPPAVQYVTVGPVQDPMNAVASDLSGQVMMMARVVDAHKSAPPVNASTAFSTKTPGLGTPADPKNQSFSVEEQVVNDIRMQAAWETTKAKAEEFKALAGKDGWDKAVAEFNKLYGKQAKADPNDPNVFRVDHQAGMQRISSADLQVLAAQVSNGPASEIVMNQARNEGQLADRLFALIPDKADAPAQMPVIVEFKPNQAFYVFKTLTMQRLTQEEFQKMKGMIVRREEYSQIENLAAVHFNPENVIKRTNFRFANPADHEPAESATKPQSKEAS